ncbi:MAG TPA: response regulator transcription factor [Solirubrobacteraceae bacterium]|jgi:DNA-binding NarL/FixJ family response regulator
MAGRWPLDSSSPSPLGWGVPHSDDISAPRVRLINSVEAEAHALGSYLTNSIPCVVSIDSSPVDASTLASSAAEIDIVTVFSWPNRQAPPIEHLPAELRSRFVLYAVPNDEGVVLACLAVGIGACVTSDCDLPELASLIRLVATGGRGCSRAAVEIVIARAVARGGSLDRKRLTRREDQVLDLVLRGRCNKEIATELRITVPTVKNHLRSCYRKLGVRNRSEAISLGLRIG